MKTFLIAIILVTILGASPRGFAAINRVPNYNLHKNAYGQKPDLLPWLEPSAMPPRTLTPANPNEKPPEFLGEGDENQNDGNVSSQKILQGGSDRDSNRIPNHDKGVFSGASE